MAEAQPTKICPLCAETIKAAAKICPYCHKAQGRLFFISRFDLLAVATSVIFALLVFLSFKIIGSGRGFSSSRDKVMILNSEFSVATNANATNVIVVGLLTNASNYSWEIGEFEIRFLNNAGETVDVETATSEFTVPPHSEHGFHLTLYGRRTIPAETNRQVTVSSATEPGSWFANLKAP